MKCCEEKQLQRGWQGESAEPPVPLPRGRCLLPRALPAPSTPAPEGLAGHSRGTYLPSRMPPENLCLVKMVLIQRMLSCSTPRGAHIVAASSSVSSRSLLLCLAALCNPCIRTRQQWGDFGPAVPALGVSSICTWGDLPDAPTQLLILSPNQAGAPQIQHRSTSGTGKHLP